MTLDFIDLPWRTLLRLFVREQQQFLKIQLT